MAHVMFNPFARCVDAWMILTGKWTLQQYWQRGYDFGKAHEYDRIIGSWGDLLPTLHAVIDAARGPIDPETTNQILAKAAQTIRRKDHDSQSEGA